jgi:hypothetical protein
MARFGFVLPLTSAIPSSLKLLSPLPWRKKFIGARQSCVWHVGV